MSSGRALGGHDPGEFGGVDDRTLAAWYPRELALAFPARQVSIPVAVAVRAVVILVRHVDHARLAAVVEMA